MRFLCVSCIVKGFFTAESPGKHLAFSYKHCCIFNIKYKICWFYILFLILHMQTCIYCSPPCLSAFLLLDSSSAFPWRNLAIFLFFSTHPRSTHVVYNTDHMSNLFVYSWPTHTWDILIMNKYIMNGAFRK